MIFCTLRGGDVLLVIDDFINLHASSVEERNKVANLLKKFLKHELQIISLDTDKYSNSALNKINEPIAETVQVLRNEYGFTPDELFEITEHLEDFDQFINS